MVTAVIGSTGDIDGFGVHFVELEGEKMIDCGDIGDGITVKAVPIQHRVVCIHDGNNHNNSNNNNNNNNNNHNGTINIT